MKQSVFKVTNLFPLNHRNFHLYLSVATCTIKRSWSALRVSTACSRLDCLLPVINDHLMRNFSTETKNNLLSKLSFIFFFRNQCKKCFWKLSGQLWHKVRTVFYITSILWNLYQAFDKYYLFTSPFPVGDRLIQVWLSLVSGAYLSFRDSYKYAFRRRFNWQMRGDTHRPAF